MLITKKPLLLTLLATLAACGGELPAEQNVSEVSACTGCLPLFRCDRMAASEFTSR